MDYKRIFLSTMKVSLILLLVFLFTTIYFSEDVVADDIYIEDFEAKIEPANNGFELYDIVVWVSNNTQDYRSITEIKLTCDSGEYYLFTPNYILDPKIPSQGRVSVPVPLNETWIIHSTCTEVTVNITQTDANSVREKTFAIDISQYNSVKMVQNLRFGTFAPDYDQPINITLSYDGNISSPTLHLRNHQVAQFIVSGSQNSPFNVDFTVTPVEIYKDGVVGSNSMTVSNFETSLVNDSGYIENDYTTSFEVGAELSVGINQPPGTYMGNFEVIIYYN
ncbi:MAG: DUF4402 domain-containing protein [Halanaerobiales bacterium]|nr:DUF4402 domain-containing protein [Halanaerobiales bacterium]